MGHLTKWDTFGWSGMFSYHFIVMKTSISGTLNKWDTSLSGTPYSLKALQLMCLQNFSYTGLYCDEVTHLGSSIGT